MPCFVVTDNPYKWSPNVKYRHCNITCTLTHTGGGKSLTFQLPALAASKGFAVVVSPLIALAKDQVDACSERDIEAELYNSTVSFERKARIHSDLACDDPSLKLLYVTPEGLGQPKLREALEVAQENGTLLVGLLLWMGSVHVRFMCCLRSLQRISMCLSSILQLMKLTVAQHGATTFGLHTLRLGTCEAPSKCRSLQSQPQQHTTFKSLSARS